MIRSLPCDERRARTAYQHHARVFGLRSSSTSRARRRPRSSRAVQRFTRACALRCAARARERGTAGDRERALPKPIFPASGVPRVQLETESAVWGCLAILRITHYACPEACPIANANASPSLRSGSTRRTGLAADRRADKSMRSQRTATGGLAAPRRRPTGPTRPTPTTGQQGYKTETNGDGRATRMREALETRRTSRQSGRRVGVYVYDAR